MSSTNSVSKKHRTQIEFDDILQQPQGDQHATTHHGSASAYSIPRPPNLLKKPRAAPAAPVVPVNLPERSDAPHAEKATYTRYRSMVNKSPWVDYNELYSLQFGTSEHFPIAERRHPQPEENPLCIVKRFSGARAGSDVRSIQRIEHPQFVPARDVYFTRAEYFVAFEFMPLSLAEVEGNPLMTDLRLASILGQIVDGLLYLEKESLGHKELKCSNILIDNFGNVKLWGQEFIQDQFDFTNTIDCIAIITMRLIQGYVKKNGRGLDEPQRCPLGFDFLVALEQMSSMKDLTKDPLLKLSWRKEKLAGLVSLVHMWCDRGYALHPKK